MQRTIRATTSSLLLWAAAGCAVSPPPDRETVPPTASSRKDGTGTPQDPSGPNPFAGKPAPGRRELPAQDDIVYDGPVSGWYGTPGVFAGELADIYTAPRSHDLVYLLGHPWKIFDTRASRIRRWGGYDIDEVERIIRERGITPAPDLRKSGGR